MATAWSRRLAVAIVLLVWPLIWVGGLVTTYDAGMSVPDWPGTYGYNLFLYPLSTWLFGPFDLLIEHGHRLLGALVGFVAIGLVVATAMTESRRWVVVLSVGVLVAVIAQGVLGGARVVLSDRTLAMAHGCTGPLLFMLSVVMAVVTGPRWRRESVTASAAAAFRTPQSLAAEGQTVENPATVPATPWKLWPIAIVGLAYLQLVLGAQLRHALPTAGPAGFSHIATTHVSTALLLWFVTAIAWWRMRRCGDLTLSRPAGALVCFVGLQIALGLGTWMVNYGFPAFAQGLPGANTYLLHSKDLFDASIVTGHVAVGSLILAVGTLLWVRIARRRGALGW